MNGRNSQINQNGRWRGRGWWVALGSLALLALALLGGADAWAAPVADRMNQTVPGRTPTPQPTDVPTVTPTSPPAPTDAPPPPNPPDPTATPAGGSSGGGSAATATPLPTNTPTAVTTPTATGTATAVPGFGLVLQMAISPTLTLQGSEVALRFVITNPGTVAAVNVQLRDELPKSLILVGSSVNGGKATVEKSGTGATILLLSWPSLAAGAKIEATVRVKIAANTPNGAVIDNLAVAWADNAAIYTAGISLGMPPALLPTFD